MTLSSYPYLKVQKTDHGPALTQFVKWCDDNYLDFNVVKTKDMIIDFRHNTVHGVRVIHGEDVQVEGSYKYLYL